MARPENPSKITSRVAKPPPEEPDAVVPHVRVCEGASGQPLALLGGFNSLTTHSLSRPVRLEEKGRAKGDPFFVARLRRMK